MQDKTKIGLVASEIEGLWISYMNDSMAACVIKYFLNRVEDEEVRQILQHALDISNGHIQLVTNVFNQEELPIPQGFTDNDVNIAAPRLYDDSFYLFYLINMAQVGMGAYTLVLNHIARSDIRDFYSNCISESVNLYNTLADTMMSQGIFIRAPRVEVPKDIDFIKDQNFFSGGMLGRKRTLLTREITSIFASLRFNIIGGALITGFAQVAKSKKVSDYFFRGRDIAGKKIKTLTNILTDDNVPIPSTSNSFVTDSTTAPFSDKLMMYHVSILNTGSLAMEGTSLSVALRHDLQAYYVGAMAGTGRYAEDGLDILIKNQWMEQPPQSIEHKNLVKI